MEKRLLDIRPALCKQPSPISGPLSSWPADLLSSTLIFKAWLACTDSPPGRREGGRAFWFLWAGACFLKNDRVHLSAQEAAKQVYKSCLPCFQVEKLTKLNNNVLIELFSYQDTQMLTCALWTLTSAVWEDLYLMFLYILLLYLFFFKLRIFK